VVVRRGLVLLVVALSLAPALAVAPTETPDHPRPQVDRPRPVPQSEAVGPTERGFAGQSARSFRQRFGGTWEVRVDRRTERPTLVRGSGVPLVPGGGNGLDERALAGLPLADGAIGLDALEIIARRFLTELGGWIEPPVGELTLDRRASTIADGERVVSLRFLWHVAGVPVEDAHVFVHINSGNLVQFGAPLVGHVPGDARPKLTAAHAVARAVEHGGDVAAHSLRGVPALAFQPEESGAAIVYRLVWIVRYRTPDGLATWEARVDARTGKVVGFVDANRYGRVIGGVYPRTFFEQNEVRAPMPYANVTADPAATVADAGGGFAYTGGPATADFDGPWIRTTCVQCTNPASPLASAASGIGWLDFGMGGVNGVGNGSSTPADRNTYYHLNQVRRIAKKWLPDLPWLDEPLFSYTNLNATCNAFYDGSVYFLRSGQGCGNTGEIADVIYHEWGHGIDLNTVEGDGATGEATADVVAMHMSHSALVGPGFYSDGTPVRNLDPNGPRGLLTTSNVGTKCSRFGTPGPLGFEIHCEGEIYGQTAWDLAQALVARHGPHTGWRVSERLFFTSLPSASGYLPSSVPSVYDAYLLADDTDGNLSNGTPHAAEIYTAFNRHGIAGAALGTTAHCARPAQPIVTATPGCDRLDLSWTSVPGAQRYEVLRGELRLDQALFSIATVLAPQTTYVDSEIAPGVDYWYTVMAVTPSGCESRIESPVAARLAPRSILTATGAAVVDANGSGFADPDEDVELVVTLANVGEAGSGPALGSASSTAPVTLLATSVEWPAIATGASADSSDSVRFRADSPANSCADVVRFRIELSDGAACPSDPSWIDVELGNEGVCEPSPPCSSPPTFAGLASATPGPPCGQVVLSWSAATRNCVNSFVRYSVYRSTDAQFVPGPASLVASGIKPTTYTDSGLQGGSTYFYAVRAVDSLGGAESNPVRLLVTLPAGPDLGPPAFFGLHAAATGQGCGVVQLSWDPAVEDCSGPIWYDVYRSADDAYFEPGPPTFVGSTTSTSFADSGLSPYAPYWYIVRARDRAGNEDGNYTTLVVEASAIDRILKEGSFEATSEGWILDPSSDATNGNWELGDPFGTAYQADLCADGVRCWITGLAAALEGGLEADVDGGQTILLSDWIFPEGVVVAPAFEYSGWLGGHPSTQLLVEVQPDRPGGAPFSQLAQIGPTAPPTWRRFRHSLSAPQFFSGGWRFRFTASEFSTVSIEEAGIDDWVLLDEAAECFGCPLPSDPVDTIRGRRQGDDVVFDWPLDPTTGARFAVYVATTPMFTDAVRIGTTEARTFSHEDGVPHPQDLYYLVSAYDTCGNESVLH